MGILKSKSLSFSTSPDLTTTPIPLGVQVAPYIPYGFGVVGVVSADTSVQNPHTVIPHSHPLLFLFRNEGHCSSPIQISFPRPHPQDIPLGGKLLSNRTPLFVIRTNFTVLKPCHCPFHNLNLIKFVSSSKSGTQKPETYSPCSVA